MLGKMIREPSGRKRLDERGWRRCSACGWKHAPENLVVVGDVTCCVYCTRTRLEEARAAGRPLVAPWSEAAARLGLVAPVSKRR